METLRKAHGLGIREEIAFDFNAEATDQYRSIIMTVLDDLVDKRDEVRLTRAKDPQSGKNIPGRITVIVGPKSRQPSLTGG